VVYPSIIDQSHGISFSDSDSELQCFIALQHTIITNDHTSCNRSLMKLNVPFALLMAVGFISTTGCIAMTNKNTVNVTNVANFTPIFNSTSPGVNMTENVTVNSSSELKGSLKVAISGILYPVSLPVIIDNITVGTVKPTKPFYLMVSEGNHTVSVCVSSICEHEYVMTKFGKYITVDFSERLLKDVEFPNPTTRPTAQIIDYYKNGDVVYVFVEFINPESIDHTISVDLSIGYTYIDDRSHVKLGDSTKTKTMLFVKAGQRETKRVVMYLGSSSVCFEIPVIEELHVK
jgi:hypothetical protein